MDHYLLCEITPEGTKKPIAWTLWNQIREFPATLYFHSREEAIEARKNWNMDFERADDLSKV